MDQNFLRDFFDNAPIGFHVFGPDRIIIDINQAELDMIGYTRQEIIGKKMWVDLIIPEEKEVFKKHWKDLQKNGLVRNISYTLVHKDGHHVEVLLNATARFDASGHLINTRGSVIDVTEHNQIERNLRTCELEVRNQKVALERSNSTLNEILTQVQEEKKTIKNNVIHNVEQIIRPLLSNLRRKGTSLDKRNIDLLAQSLEQVTTEFGRQLVDQKWKLSRREIEICHMIKNGITTKEIADLLCVSIRTVDNHRDHIRKKFNIVKSVNLVTFLHSFD